MRTPILTVALIVCLAPAMLRASIVSTFDTDTDGWTRGGGDNNSLVGWSASTGNPGGCLTMQDEAAGTTDYWKAPAKFLGDQSAMYEGTLSYDLRLDRTGQNFADIDVVLAGNGHTLSGFFNFTPTTDFTTFSILLKEGPKWHEDGSGGGPPDAAQFRGILANLTGIQIRADYLNGAEVNSLDNVTLAPVPEPTCGLLLAGLLPFLPLRRQVRTSSKF